MYKIELSKNVEKVLTDVFKADRKLYGRLINVIEALSENPFVGKKLKGPLKGDYSLRVGSYRIIYCVSNKKLIVYIIDLGHRREIYK